MILEASLSRCGGPTRSRNLALRARRGSSCKFMLFSCQIFKFFSSSFRLFEDSHNKAMPFDVVRRSEMNFMNSLLIRTRASRTKCDLLEGALDRPPIDAHRAGQQRPAATNRNYRPPFPHHSVEFVLIRSLAFTTLLRVFLVV